MKNQLPYCPYCKQRVSYLETWGVHKEGEYTCKRCERVSNIRYTKRIKTFALIASSLGAALTLLFSLVLKYSSVIQIILVLLPFLLFFLLTPFTMVLQPFQIRIKQKRRVPGSRPPSRENQRNGNRGAGETTVMPPIKPRYPYAPAQRENMQKTQQLPRVRRVEPPVEIPDYQGYSPKHGPQNPIGDEDIDQILKDFIDE